MSDPLTESLLWLLGMFVILPGSLIGIGVGIGWWIWA